MSNGTEWPGQQDSPVVMLGDELSGWASAFGPQVLGRWNSVEQDVVPTALQWAGQLKIGSAFQGFVGDRFILGGIAHGSLPLIGEFDATTGALLHNEEFGDNRSSWGAYLPDGRGGLAAVVYSYALPVNEVRLDVLHRPNHPIPTVPPGSQPPVPWFKQRLTYPSAFGTNALTMFLSAARSNDGLLNFFFCRDSSKAVGRLRFRVGTAGLTVEGGFDQRFIHEGQGDISPSGELPEINAANDAENNRIILAYHNQPHRDHPVLKVMYPTGPVPWILSRWALTQVLADGTPYLLGVTPWWSAHITFPKPVIIPRHDGIWFALECVEDDGSQHWKVGRFRDGKFEVMGLLPHGKVLAYTRDGWILFLDIASNTTSLLRIPFGPKLTIERRETSVIVDWKPFSPGDMLQERLEGGEWQTPYVCVPPATLPLNSSSKTFRVVQNIPIQA